jgi:PEP-CTERM motif
MRIKFIGIVAALALAAFATSANAAITLTATKIADLASGSLQQWQVSAVGSAAEQINTFSFLNLTGSAGLLAPHQVWNAISNGITPTTDEAQGALFNAAWSPYDTHFLFGANDLALNLGSGWTETNDLSTTNTLGLPQQVGTNAPSGYGNLNSLPTGSRVVLPAKAGSNVAFLQVVIKAGNPALLDVQVNAPGQPDAIFTDFVVGGGVPPVLAPVVTPLSIINNTLNATVGGTVTATNAPTSWLPAGPGITLASYVPGFGAAPGAPGLLVPALWNPANQAFSWNTAGSTRGTYVWNVSATNTGGTGNGTITVEQHAVPEPATIAMAGLALVGVVGFARRRS